MRVLLCALLVLSTSLLFAKENKDTIQVVVLGTYHMGNPGLDLHNAKADDVTSPQRLKELAAVAEKLAKFNPTKIAVERISPNQDLTDAKFAEFNPGQLSTSKDERVQIGYRLAHLLKHKKVYAIDEQSKTIDYFPFDKVENFTKANGKSDSLQKLHNIGESRVKAFEKSQSTSTISELLLKMNDPMETLEDHELFYYSMLQYGNTTEQPGAELNAYWYMRNAKIFSKLIQISEPGDRILVIYGAGHNYWLKHFAQHTPGFQLIEVHQFLSDKP